jgi:hypothetical protein
MGANPNKGWGQNEKEGKNMFKVRLDVNDADGVIYDTRSVQSFVELENQTDLQEQVKIEWSISTDNYIPLFKTPIQTITIGQGLVKSYCPHFQFPGPGFYRIEARVSKTDGEVFERIFNSGPVIERNRILCNDQGGNVHAIDFDLWNSVFPGITTNVGENLILGEIFGGLPDNGLPQLIHHNIFTSGNGFSSAMNITECASNLKVFSNTVIGGSGIWIQGGNYPDIRNNIVAYANVGIEIWADTVTIAYNNIWDCKTPYSGVSDQTGINGNISADPGFIDRANGDFHFFCWSACIDAGDPLSDYLQEPAPNGGRINLGCYGNTSEADPTVECLRIIPEYIDFGYVPVNKQKDTTVILVNAGPVQLDISSVSNSNIISFGTSYPGGTTILNPGDSLTLIVVFHPFINKTHYSDSIIVTSNSPSPGNIYLNGHTALGLNDIETIRKLKLYPVPVTGDCFYLEPGTAWPREVLVEIFNISGKLVFSQMLIPQEGQPLKIYPGKLAAGMFFLKITSDSSPRKLGDIFFCIQPACPY